MKDKMEQEVILNINKYIIRNRKETKIPCNVGGKVTKWLPGKNCFALLPFLIFIGKVFLKNTSNRDIQPIFNSYFFINKNDFTSLFLLII